MSKSAIQPRRQRASGSRIVTAELKRLRQRAEDLLSILDALEARVRNLGKPRVSHAEVLRKLSAK